ncbi:MAG TPA: SH3 domain-containing protein [Methylomirabilota bacterium]|nr:SH3 domain-containing protein [Methylomirabilota bacterium]
MGILAAVKWLPSAVVAGFSAVFRGVGRATKPTAVTMQCCQSCGEMRMTKFVAFYRNVGMLFRRQTYTLMGNLCETCVHKHFWKFEVLDVVLGPWGMISAILAPIYFVQNIFSYVAALYQFERAGTEGQVPQASRFPLLKVLAVVAAAVVVLLAVRTITKRQRAAAIFANASAQHETEQILCGDKFKSVKLFSTPDYQAAAVTSLACGESVIRLAHQGNWTKLQTQKGDEGFLPKWYVGLPANSEPEKIEKCNRPSPMQNVEQFQKLKASIDGFIDAEGISDKDFRDTTEDLASGAYFLAYLAADDGGKSKAVVLMDAVNDPKIEDTFSKLSASEQDEMRTWYSKNLAVMSKAFDLGYEEGAKLPCNPN